MGWVMYDWRFEIQLPKGWRMEVKSPQRSEDL
jgi:hypothetical protein